MNPFALFRFVLVAVAAALLAGCGALLLSPSKGQDDAQTVNDASSYRVLHRFGCVKGAGAPVAPLLDVNGTLYGTTPGNQFVCPRHRSGNGTVFSISTTGIMKELYHFKGGASDGAGPSPDGLIDVNGTLYGTTSGGGGTGCEGNGCGTVFSISTSGLEKVLYSFKGGSDDGASPYGLVEVNGTLYGTTVLGGARTGIYCSITGNSLGCGTVFSVSTSGSEKVLHVFTGVPDGANPQSGLTEVNGTLYGITYDGGGGCKGRNGGSCPSGIGTVYSITTSGSEKVLHRFTWDSGPFPTGGVVDVGGVLYGTTGGTFSPCCGTVYRLGTSGAYQVLYRFQGDRDGAFPSGGLTSANGLLYGTTQNGGVVCAPYTYGCGTVFSVTTTGAETVLHRFRGNGGRNPQAALVAVNDSLYGTTVLGGYGACDHGCGVIFALSP